MDNHRLTDPRQGLVRSDPERRFGTLPTMRPFDIGLRSEQSEQLLDRLSRVQNLSKACQVGFVCESGTTTREQDPSV
jgi:hypothetical protein